MKQVTGGVTNATIETLQESARHLKLQLMI